MAEALIVVRNVSKRYQVFENQRTRLLQAFWPRTRPGVTDVWALQDVDFEIARGESVGVIGRNGGGKSTLLQILTGVLAPTSGEVSVNGRVSALLELGSGFNPEYTGRDNVVMNGLLLGLSREQIAARFSEILAFAEIGEAIDRPVKTYSSGMTMRLAFAVQAFTDPDILIVDEALSVGDFFFQQKCFRHIRSLRDRGVTLILVSHDMSAVRDLCSRVIYLRQSRIAFAGDAAHAIRHFLSERGAQSQDVTSTGAGSQRNLPETDCSLPVAPFWRRPVLHAESLLLAVEVIDSRGEPAARVRMGETVKVRIFFRAPPERAGHISLVIRNRYDQVVTSINSHTMGLPPLSSGEAAFGILQLEVDMALEGGPYSLNVAFGRPLAANSGELWDETGWMGPLQVQWDYENDTAPFLGMFGLPVRSEVFIAAATRESGSKGVL